MADFQNGHHGLAARPAVEKVYRTVQDRARILSQNTTALNVLEIGQEQEGARSRIAVSFKYI